jgi:hypothetical protein
MESIKIRLKLLRPEIDRGIARPDKTLDETEVEMMLELALSALVELPDECFPGGKWTKWATIQVMADAPSVARLRREQADKVLVSGEDR